MRCRLPSILRLELGLSALLIAGCGGGPDDPFDRADVTGTVKLDGGPLKYGEVTFRGDAPKDATERAQATLEIRDGTFSSNRAAKPGAGQNKVLVIAYEGDPPPPEVPGDESGDGRPEPKVVGYYSTELQVEDGAPLAIEITRKDLSRSPPE